MNQSSLPVRQAGIPYSHPFGYFFRDVYRMNQSVRLPNYGHSDAVLSPSYSPFGEFCIFGVLDSFQKSLKK